MSHDPSARRLNANGILRALESLTNAPTNARPTVAPAPASGAHPVMFMQGILLGNEILGPVIAVPNTGRMKYFYDTEFLEDGQTIELISIGIVAEDGREYYAV